MVTLASAAVQHARKNSAAAGRAVAPGTGATASPAAPPPGPVAPALAATAPDGPERGERAGTLARGLAIADALTAAPQPLTLAEVAAATGLDQSTAHRLLKALEDSGHVVRHDAARRYSPSPKLLRPLPLLHPLDQLRREAAPVLGELALRLRLTMLLVVFIGQQRLVLDLVQVPGSLLPYYGSWLQGPLHAAGAGKSLLLGLDGAQRRSLLGPEPWQACTPQTLTTWPQLDADLRLSAERGYVVSRNEHRQGVTNICALLTRWTGGAAGCLIATARSQDMDDDAIASVGAEVRHAAGLLVYQAPSLEAASRFCAA